MYAQIGLELEQLERQAYAQGNTREAALLSAIIDLYNLGLADDVQDAVLDKLWHKLKSLA
jgi:hypothetical protein